MAIYGYCYLRTAYESSSYQINRILEKYPEAEIIESSYTSSNGITDFINSFKEDDILVISDLIRLFNENSEKSDQINQIKEILENYETIFAKGVDIVILDSPHLNSDIFRTALTLNNTKDKDALVAAVSYVLEHQIESEVKKILSSKKEQMKYQKKYNDGMSVQKHPGNIKGLGYFSKLEDPCKEFIRTRVKEFGGDLTNEQAIEELGVARNTYFKYKKQVKNELGLEITRPVIDKDMTTTASPETSIIKDSVTNETEPEFKKSTKKPEEASTEKKQVPEKADNLQEEKPIKDTEKDKKKSKNIKEPSGNVDIKGQTSIFDFL